MATQFTGPAQSFGSGLFDTGTYQSQVIGDKAFTNDGRIYRFAYVQPTSGGATGQPTGTTLVVGNLLQSPAQIANHIALTPTQAQAVGDTTLVATLGATAAYANQYAGGVAIISTTPGNGYAYKIKSHAAVASAGVITLTLEDAIQVATTTSSRIDLQINPYLGVLQNPTTATGIPVGTAVSAIAATATTGSFGWVQTRGMSGTLVQSTPAVGASLMPSTTTAGAVTTLTAGTPQVGRMLTTGVNGKNNAVDLCID